MRRLIIYPLVLVAAFTIGVSVKILTASHPATYAAIVEEIEPAPALSFRAANLSSGHAIGRFNPSGDYHPLNRMIDESEKSTYFDLRVRRLKGTLRASGEIKNHAGTSYKFASVSITEQSLRFTTLNIRGVEYRFDGRFLGRGDFARQTTDEGQVMLEGTLQKFIDGEKVAETQSAFLYFPGC